MRLYRTQQGTVVEEGERFFRLNHPDWDDLLNSDDLAAVLARAIGSAEAVSLLLDEADVLAPIGSQEVWAAGVTYHRSRDARIEESQASGGDDFYARVYEAARPELFFKATSHRVVGHGQPVRIRCDSEWNVPEPELALVINAAGSLIGYTVGNDMSSRDIEGENPLYLPQAKVYNQCCALGPGILVSSEPLPTSTLIKLEIRRGSETPFAGETSLERLKRKPAELISYLFRENSFPAGCFLLTGTGIVPPSTFTLQAGDEVRIQIDGIGTLVNQVVRG